MEASVDAINEARLVGTETTLTIRQFIEIVNAAPRAVSGTGFDLVHREDILRKLPRPDRDPAVQKAAVQKAQRYQEHPQDYLSDVARGFK